MKRTAIITILCLFALAGVAYAQATGEYTTSSEEAAFEEPSPYLIQPDDLLLIQLHSSFPGSDMQELKELAWPGLKVRVSETGKIKYPFIGTLEVAGLTELEASELLESRLKAGYIKEPQVSVLLVEKAGFSVIGQVAKPGIYPIRKKDTTLAEAIASAGGLLKSNMTIGLDITAIAKIYREIDGEKKEITLDLSGPGNKFFRVLPQDIIVIEQVRIDTADKADRGTFHITGQVNAPGRYFIYNEDDIRSYLQSDSAPNINRINSAGTVVDAIYAAGGFTEFANKNGVRLHRMVNGTIKTFRIPVAYIGKSGDDSRDIKLKDGDWIYVEESWF